MAKEYKRNEHHQICIFCGKHFVGASEVSQVCDTEKCQTRYRKIIVLQKNTRKRMNNPNIKICRHCEKPFECDQNNLKNYRKIFCKECKSFEKDYFERKRRMRRNLKSEKGLSQLAIVARRARENGLSYGYYVASMSGEFNEQSFETLN